MLALLSLPLSQQQSLVAKSSGAYTFNVTLPHGKVATFDVEMQPDWAPKGAQRFEELVKQDFFNDVRFFRVVDGFMAQFGISGDPQVAAKWRGNTIPDDADTGHSNERGTISFATSGPDSRTTQMFINLVDNSRLDSMGFTPFGKISTSGMRVVDQIENFYGEGAPGGNGPDQGRIQMEGNTYLMSDFPRLSFINSVKPAL